MMLPRYSMRTVLYLAALVAMIALVAGQGVQGAPWAIAFTVGVCSLAVCWLMYILFYGVISLFARLVLGQNLQQATGGHYPTTRPTAEPSTTVGESSAQE
ncbi:hypothetical protein [Aeoliella mucimassa]|uniref:Uncharacterized protein n=1 Tax=Aeoliella mucimassa TaxID=2527972 RepID=A0A518AQZ7_9BACT|nr:hypothetical protein [Aeoliella mucimassa]QDU57136.1 hypothetical protein Pan181_33500 [Aeoliella mucimassa]